MFCTGCGERLEDAALFCTSCGQNTENASAPAPPPPVAPAPTLAAAPPPGPAAKPGNAKLLVWMGALVVLIAVTGGLAYIAFQRFVHSGDVVTPETPQAQVEPEGSAPAVDDLPGERAAADMAQSPAPVPVVAPKPAPAPPPQRASAPKPPAPVVAPKPVAAPKLAEPVEPVVAPAPAPPPAAPVVKSEAVQTEPPPPPAPKGSKVILPGADAYSPPAPKPASPTAPAAPPVRAAPASGDIFWSGTLDKNQVVTVDFASGAGGIGGQPLPGKPVKLEVFSPVVEITELPGADNGWKRFSFKATRNAKKSVTLNFHWTLAR